jgi:hypothetical protein
MGETENHPMGETENHPMGESSPNLVTLIDMLRSDAGEKILF